MNWKIYAKKMTYEIRNPMNNIERIKIDKIKIETVLMMIFVVLGIGFCTRFNERPLREGIIYLLFQIVCIIVPGIAFTLLVNKKIESRVELFAYGYILGYCLNIFVYYLFVPFKLQETIKYFYLLIFILSCIFIFKLNGRINALNCEWHDCGFCLFFITIIFVLQVILFNANNLPASIVGNTTHSSDLMYWIGDAIELSKEYPPLLFRDIERKSYYYHYFSSMQLALSYIITKIPMTIIAFSYSYIQPTLLLVFSAYIFFRKTLKCNYMLTVALTILYFFSTGYEAGFGINYISHMYCASFGFDISMAMAMVTLSYLVQISEEKNDGWRTYLCMTMTFIVCLGTKGPIGMLILLNIGIIYIFKFFKDRKYKSTFLSGSMLVIIFIVMYLFVIGGKASTASTMTVGAGQGLTSSFYGTKVFEYYLKLRQFHYPQYFAYFLCAICFMVGSNYGIYILFFLCLFINKKFDRYDIASLIVCIVGCILTLVIKHPSWSQQYFMMATFPSAMLLVARRFKEWTIEWKNKGFLKKGWLFLAIFIIFNLYNFIKAPFFQSYYSSGSKCLITKTMPIASMDNPNYVTVDEQKAYEWIRENTEKDSIFACNFILGENKIRLYAPGVFTERYIWMGDEKLISKCLEHDKDAIERLKEKDIDYIIVINRISMADPEMWKSVNLVFWNGDVEIYKIDG